MKALFTFIGSVLLSALILAQVPETFKYQAVIGDADGEILANTTVALRISVLQDSEAGTAVYEETFHPLTSPQGMVDLELGNGSFNSLDWGGHAYFLKIEVDPDNGTSFTHLGTSPLLSVPYALHARTVEMDMVDDADSDPGNELQTLSLDGSDLTIADGNTVTLPSSPWVLNGNDIYFGQGNVGIGTSSPTETFYVLGQSLFNVGTGTIQITTPGSYPGFIGFDIASNNRRDIVFRPEGIALTASTSGSGPGINDGIYIREGGNLGIQTASTGNYPLFVNERAEFGIAISRAAGGGLWELFTASTGTLNLYRASSVLVGSFDGSTGVYTPISDRRAKKDIQPLKNALSDLQKIKPSTYLMKADTDGNREIGLVAQDLKEYFPELVYEINDDKSGEIFYTVNYNGIAVVAVKAIQEQQELIEYQSAQIEALQQKIQALEDKLNSF